MEGRERVGEGEGAAVLDIEIRGGGDKADPHLCSRKSTKGIGGSSQVCCGLGIARLRLVVRLCCVQLKRKNGGLSS